MTGVSRRAGLPTASLRRRVMLYSLAVLGLVLVGVSVLAEVFVGIQSRSDLVSRLNERALLADQLASQGVSPSDLVDRVSGAAIRARLVLPDGTVYGVRTPPDHDQDLKGAPTGPATPSAPDAARPARRALDRTAGTPHPGRRVAADPVRVLR
jgi:hypothetical protein